LEGSTHANIATMTIPKPHYRVKVGNMPEEPVFVDDEGAFARKLRGMLNDRKALRGLGDDMAIVYTRPDGTIHEITVGQARRSVA
jgi:hypothetical protein